MNRLLGIRHSIVQAPMAGVDSPELAAAVCDAGALGSLGVGYLAPAEIRDRVGRLRALTQKPFALNLFPLPAPAVDRAVVEAANGALAKYRRELGIVEPPLPEEVGYHFERQAEAMLELRPAVFSFAFGIPDSSILDECRKRGIVTCGTATHLPEALALDDAGVDLICAQGSEAGGHRATFAGETEHGLLGLLALIPQIVDRVKRPILAAGGIMDRRGVRAALDLGAAGVQVGTAFLACRESGISPAHRRALFGGARATGVTRVFSGRPARGVENRMMRELQESGAVIAPYPIQHRLTSDIRREAARVGNTELMSLWSGQAAALAQDGSVAELIERLTG
jgi:nitronate monooxygenase